VVFTALIGLPFGFGITWVQVLGGVLVVAAVVLLARRSSSATTQSVEVVRT
jgi:drug/metabolite transporter (DMT)-like permease